MQVIKGMTKEEKSEKEGGQDKKIYRSVKEKNDKGEKYIFFKPVERNWCEDS